MKKALLGLGLLTLVAWTMPAPVRADASVFIGLPGFSLFAGPPVVAPPVVVGPPPVVYAPPVYYGRPYYYPYPRAYYRRPYAPVYRPYWGPGKHKGWYKHGRW
jgi:hypothetical protein